MLCLAACVSSAAWCIGRLVLIKLLIRSAKCGLLPSSAHPPLKHCHPALFPPPLPPSSYHQQSGFMMGHHWSPGRQVVMQPSRRRHPSDSPVPLLQHVPSHHQWPPTTSVACKSSSGSVSSYSQQSFSNPRSPTGSCYSEGDVFPVPPDYPPHSLVDGYYHKPLPPPAVGTSLHPTQWHFDSSEVRRRSVAGVYSAGSSDHRHESHDRQLWCHFITPCPSPFPSPCRWSLASAHLPYNHQQSDSFNGPCLHPVNRERCATLPYSQQTTAERNIYERVCDVQYGAAQPGPSRGGAELHRAPSVQSVGSSGSGSVRLGTTTDYPRQWGPDRRAGSRENVAGPPPYAHPPSHPHSTRTPNYAHYRQDSTDSGSQHRGDSGNHGNQSTYLSPDSGDSGFLSHPSSEMDSRGNSNGQTHIYSEIGR